MYDTYDVLAVVDENKEFSFLLHIRKNHYTRGGHAIPVVNNARIYSTIKDLSVGEARLTEESRRFSDSSVNPFKTEAVVI